MSLDDMNRADRRSLIRFWPRQNGKTAGSEREKRAGQVGPLPHSARVGGYLEQTGRSTMTPRQRRRAQHKQNHHAAAARRSLRTIQEALRG